MAMLVGLPMVDEGWVSAPTGVSAPATQSDVQIPPASPVQTSSALTLSFKEMKEQKKKVIVAQLAAQCVGVLPHVDIPAQERQDDVCTVQQDATADQSGLSIPMASSGSFDASGTSNSSSSRGEVRDEGVQGDLLADILSGPSDRPTGEGSSLDRNRHPIEEALVILAPHMSNDIAAARVGHISERMEHLGAVVFHVIFFSIGICLDSSVFS